MEFGYRNPNLNELNEDFLYHLGLNVKMGRDGELYVEEEHEGIIYKNPLEKMFGDVKFVCMGGSAARAETFARKVVEDLGLGIPEKNIWPIGKTERGSMFKVGPVISMSHGMGMPSMTIFLHEIAKLLEHAGAMDVKFIRIGTSGGVGVEPGTVIVAEEGMNGKLEAAHEAVVLGQVRSYPTRLDEQMREDILAVAGDIRVQVGKTMGADDFYEGQGRLDGAVNPGYTEEDKMVFLHKAHEAGVRNIEMEAPAFAAFCLRAGIPAALVCTALVNRLEGDQVTSTKEQLAEYSGNAQELVVRYIKKALMDEEATS